MLGILEESVYESEEHNIQCGDMLVMYTDGLSEATGPDDEEQFGDTRLLEVIQSIEHEPSEVVEALFTNCNFFTREAALHDDTTVLVLSRS